MLERIEAAMGQCRRMKRALSDLLDELEHLRREMEAQEEAARTDNAATRGSPPNQKAEAGQSTEAAPKRRGRALSSPIWPFVLAWFPVFRLLEGVS